MRRKLLYCGIIAGPLFIAASLIQAFTRTGFDLARHPLSLLSLGSLGWLQIINFVVSGILYVLGAGEPWPGSEGRVARRSIVSAMNRNLGLTHEPMT